MKSPQKQHVDSTGMKSPQMKSPSGQSTPDTPLNTLWIPCVLGKHVICYTKGKFPDQSLCFAPFWRGFAAFGRHFCKLKSILEATKQIRGPHEVGRSHRYHYLPRESSFFRSEPHLGGSKPGCAARREVRNAGTLRVLGRGRFAATWGV